jgi:hypothetical protein
MRPRGASVALACATLALLGLASTAGAAATRTWISGVGSDANPCSRTAPCKTLAGAIAQTADGGEIDALDPGGYGPVTITQSVTIDFAGVEGSVLNSGTNGIIVNSPTADVILRNLAINGGRNGTGTCTAWGINGVWVREARSVRIEALRISDQSQAGIAITPAASDPKVLVSGTTITNNCANGITAAATGGHQVTLAVTSSSIFDSGIALNAGDGVAALLAGSTITGSAVGLAHAGTGTIDSYPDNVIAQNAIDGAATTQRTIKGDTGASGPAGATGAAGAAGPTGATGPAAFKLVVAPVTASLRAKAGATVKLKYVATAAAKATLTVTKGTKKVATVVGSAVSGTNAIAWNGKAGKKRALKGAYRLALRAVGTDGQVATTTASLTLR